MRRQARLSSSSDYSDVTAVAGLLHTLEINDCASISENCLQLGILGRGEIALCQNDLIVCRHANAKLAVFGVELLLCQVAGGLRRLNTLGRVLHLHGGVADVARDLQLELPELHLNLALLNPG